MPAPVLVLVPLGYGFVDLTCLNHYRAVAAGPHVFVYPDLRSDLLSTVAP